MVVSHKLKTIFVHIQKTGGSSIEETLRVTDDTIGSHLYLGRRHYKSVDFKLLLDDDIWKSYFKFSFVRNPWDRLASWYSMFQRPEVNDFGRYITEHYPTFELFIKDATHGFSEKVTWNQYDFLFDQQNSCMVDYIGRFENLENDFSTISSKLGIITSLPHINATPHKPYREFYTEEMKEIVEKRFYKDIEYFGYEF